jgi:hypothetical protein
MIELEVKIKTTWYAQGRLSCILGINSHNPSQFHHHAKIREKQNQNQ